MHERFDIAKITTAVIFGAGHGIGFALVKKISQLNPNVEIHATYRNKNKADDLLELEIENHFNITTYHLDPDNEIELENFAELVKKFDLLINAIGVLHDNSGLEPEKSLKDITYDNLIHSFKINAAYTPMIAKYFLSKCDKSSLSAFVTISAKVGSLADNRMGGWYAYRASKAALNMFLINISHEAARKHLKNIVLAIHPGTTKTELSKPFTGKTSLKLHTPEETATNILKVIQDKSLDESGRFYSWDGEKIPW